MADHSSATVREHTPHLSQPSRTNTIINALKRRARARLNDESLDPQSRAILRYALETHDPWLAELVRRADAGEGIADISDFDATTETNYDNSSAEKIEALTEMICRASDEPETKSAALLVLMVMIENSPYPKALANTAKHFAFTRCAEMNLYGTFDAQVQMMERELFAHNSHLS